MKVRLTILVAVVFLLGILALSLNSKSVQTKGIDLNSKVKRLNAFPENYEKPRVIVSTDIGGGDFDDVQSMIHYVLYMDMFDTEAIISSMPRPGKRYWKEIMRSYRRDYKNLSFHSADYPTPRELRKLYKLGSTSKFPGNRFRGARQIIKAVKSDDPRPVYVLIWGSATDLAIALKKLRNRPNLYKKIRPVMILNGKRPLGFNGDGDSAAWEYVINFPIKKLAFDSMIRGIYVTGMHGKGKYTNVGFVRKVVRKHGRLGRLFHRRSATINTNRYGIKMGDTPSVFFVMNGDWDNPKKPSWAGKFCRLNKTTWWGCRSKKVGGYPGAGWIAEHRMDYLRDFEKRLKRLDPIEQ